MTQSDINTLLAPRSVAVIGASADEGKLSGRTLRYLRAHGFGGKIYAVNPRLVSLNGVECVADIGDLPSDVDVAVILLPLSQLADALRACGKQRVKFAISVAGNTEEHDEQALRDELRGICREYGIRLVGHNGIGMVVPKGGVTATIAAAIGLGMPASGSISLITQSGALGNALLQGFQRTGLGLRMWISSGNEIDLDVIEISRMLLDDDETQVIALFVEALRDGERFLPLARLARERGKAIVVRRAGRSDAGRMASATHTGKMAGSARVWAGLVRQGGLIEVGSIDEMLDVLLAFEVLGMPAPHEIPGLGVVSVSGGVGVVIADEATDHGLPLPAFLPATQALLREHLGTHIALDNPLDTSYISESAFCKLAESLLQDPAVGTVLMVYMSLLHDADKLLPPMLDAARHARATGKHLLLSPISANDPLPDEVRARLLQAGVLTLPSVERSVAALGTRSLALRTETGQEQCAQAAVEPGRADVAEAACIPAPAQRLCTNLSDAMQFAASCGYPVALKVDSPDIPHKTEVGGVALGIVDEAALQHAWDLMNASIARNAPHADVKGYLVQKMIDDAVELITGCSRDAEFGPVMMIGWGGIHAEILQDMQFLALPARRSEIVAALQGLRVHKVLAGARGKPPADTEAAIDAMLRLSEVFLARTDLSEIDLNPLLVRPKGHGIAAVDVLAA